MKIESLEQLEGLIQLATQHNLQAISVGDIVIHLNPALPPLNTDTADLEEYMHREYDDPSDDPDLYPGGVVPRLEKLPPID